MKTLRLVSAGLFICTGLFLLGCAHNENKAEKIDTDMKSKGSVTGEEVGIKHGDMIVQRKTLMSEQLRDIQYEVYSLEETVYGNATYGTLGMYGVLKNCRLQLVDKRNGGDGKLIWTEPLDRVTNKEQDFKIGVDENDKLVAVSEEFLKDRIARFKEYKNILLKRQTEYQTKVDVCKAELAARQYDRGRQETQEQNQ
jgi:hypothetical protein